MTATGHISNLLRMYKAGFSPVRVRCLLFFHGDSTNVCPVQVKKSHFL